EKLEIINYQLSQQQKLKRKKAQYLLIVLSIIIIITFVILFLLKSPYLNWDYSDPENAVFGVTFHTFEWIFVRIAPIVFISSIVGIVIIQKKK
ncbi:MAG: transcriptional regulator, partial [Bacilli bacterium]|nr:transcriptional regulator [Bacilli bacterium]